jgi:hypothetical protein
MQTSASKKQVIYIFGNNNLMLPLSQIYPPATKLSTPIKKIIYPPATKLSKTNNISEPKLFANNEISYPLHQLCPNNEEIYPLHQLYPNNRSGVGADPFLWLFPDPERLLDQYVPYLLQLYSQQTKQSKHIFDDIETDKEVMKFFNNNDLLDK